MSSERVKKELYETAMTGEKALTSLMYVQMTLYAAKSQKTYAKVRGEGRAMMRHTGIHMNQYLRAAGNDLESFRIRLKETQPDRMNFSRRRERFWFRRYILLIRQRKIRCTARNCWDWKRK